MSRMFHSNKQVLKCLKIVKKCYTFHLDFSVWSFKQRHPYFQPERTPFDHFRASVFIHVINFPVNRYLIFCNILSKVQEIIFHFNYIKLPSCQTNSPKTPHYHKVGFCFSRNLLPLHKTRSDLVLCALITHNKNIILYFFVIFVNNK